MADEFDDLTGDEPEARLHPILTNEEVLEARAKAKKQVDADRRAAAMRAVQEAEVERLRIEEGLTTGIEEDDRIVHFTVDLPEFANKIVLSGRPYWHGRGYDVPMHVARTLAEQQFRAWTHDEQKDGKSIAQKFAVKRANSINAATGAITGAMPVVQ